MNWTGIIFTLVLAVLSGIVAYTADRVGWRVAKRKISLMGLRPRVISSAIAVLTGIVIALATLGVLLISSDNVREMILEFDQLQRQVSETGEKLQQARARLAEVSRERERAEEELKKVSRQRDELRAQLDTLSREVAAQNRRLSQLTGELASLQADLEKTRRDYQRVREELSAEKSRFEKEIDELRKERDRLQKQIELQRQMRDALVKEGQELEEELFRLRHSKVLLYANNPLLYLLIPKSWSKAQVEQAVRQVVKKLTVEFEKRNIEVEPPDPEIISGVAERLSQSDQDMVLIVVARENLFVGDRLRLDFLATEQKVVYRRGEVLSRFKVPAGLSRSAAARLLEQELNKLHDQAVKDGILPSPQDLSVGTMSRDTLTGWIDQLAGRERPARAKIVAKRDFRVLDRMDDLALVVEE